MHTILVESFADMVFLQQPKGTYFVNIAVMDRECMVSELMCDVLN
jgi:hypothetical protein